MNEPSHKSPDAELQGPPPEYSFIAVGPLRGVRLVDQVAPLIPDIGCDDPVKSVVTVDMSRKQG